MIVSRTADAMANQGVQPIRRINGPVSHQASRAVDRMVPTTASQMTAPRGSTAIGAMVSPANGGYVKPYGVSGRSQS